MNATGGCWARIPAWSIETMFLEEKETGTGIREMHQRGPGKYEDVRQQFLLLQRKRANAQSERES